MVLAVPVVMLVVPVAVPVAVLVVVLVSGGGGALRIPSNLLASIQALHGRVIWLGYSVLTGICTEI